MTASSSTACGHTAALSCGIFNNYLPTPGARKIGQQAKSGSRAAMAAVAAASVEEK
jgi:hypothetical protein